MALAAFMVPLLGAVSAIALIFIAPVAAMGVALLTVVVGAFAFLRFRQLAARIGPNGLSVHAAAGVCIAIGLIAMGAIGFASEKLGPLLPSP